MIGGVEQLAKGDVASAGFFALSSTATAIVGHDGAILRVNPAWLALVGSTRLGQLLTERVAAEDRASLVSAMVGLRVGTPAERHLRLVRDDAREVEVTCELTAENGGDWFYCAARVVPWPPLRKGRPDLLASLLAPLDETDMIGLVLVSNVAQRPVYANATAGRIWGIPNFAERAREGTITSEEVRRCVDDIVLEPHQLEIMRRELASEGGRREFELLLRGDRSVLWLVIDANDSSGRRIGALYISREITQRRMSEAWLELVLEAQRRSEAEFRRLLELVPDGIAVLRDHTVVYANPAVARIFGCERPDELIGMHVRALVRTEDLVDSVDRLQRIANGEGATPEVRPFVRRDGKVGAAETIGFPIEFDGAPATLTIIHDITEARQLEAKMRQAERLASLGTLSAAIAHEINNPLAYILLNLAAMRRWLGELVGAGASGAANASGAPAVLARTIELLDQSLEGAERVRAIVRDLRGFSHADDSETALLDVRSVIESVIPMADHEVRQRATLVRRYEAVPLVRANAARLGQVFLNLLVNAAHAIPEGQDAHEVRIATFVDGANRVVVTVEDTGEGMSADVRERVFEPFFTSKGPGVGTGLGLSLCLGIVQAIGGEIGVESELGRGSVFRVTLPAAPPQSVVKPTLPASLDIPPSKILVVDDEPRIASRLAELLQEHDVVVATSGREALARLREDAFDLVLCDLMMPDLKGVDVFETIVVEQPRLQDRFIFMTAGAFTPSARALLDRGTNLRLDKPFTVTQVQHALALVLGTQR